MTPKISVIVPVYNAEQWLRRCVDSILAQTFKDFELLLIDDGSKDQSGAICDEYAAIDSRVRVFHKPNGGVSSARNLGLDNARGEWITFCDSDDFIENRFIETLMNTNEDVDLVVGDFRLENTLEDWQDDRFSYGDYNYDELCKLLSTKPNSVLLSAPWAKLFKIKIIRQIKLRFDLDLVGGEDTIFVYEYLKHIYKLRHIRNAVYHYNRIDTGLSTNVSNGKSVFKFADKILELGSYMENTFGIQKTKFVYHFRGTYILPYIYSNTISMSYFSFKNHINRILENKCFRIILEELYDNPRGKREKIFAYLLKNNHILILKLWIYILSMNRLSPI